MGAVPTHRKTCKTLKCFPCKCPKCGDKVIFWSCTCGSKVYFDVGSANEQKSRHGCMSNGNTQPFRKQPGLNSLIKCPKCDIWVENGLLSQHLEFQHQPPLWRGSVKSKNKQKPKSTSPAINSKQSIQTKPTPPKLPVVDVQKTPTHLDIKGLLKNAFDESKKVDGWVSLGEFSAALRKISPGFTPSRYGYGKLSQMVAAFPELIEQKVDKDNRRIIRFIRHKK